MYWFIVAALVVLNVIAALWTATGIRRERRKKRESAKRNGMARGRMKAGKGGRRGKSAYEAESAPYMPGGKRWKAVLENTYSKEIYERIFCRSLGIGRAEGGTAFESFISIPYDRRISKVHCSVVVSADSLYLKDEGSTNHTYLNGRRVNAPEILKKGDVISIGETEIRVVKIFREAAQS